MLAAPERSEVFEEGESMPHGDATAKVLWDTPTAMFLNVQSFVWYFNGLLAGAEVSQNSHLTSSRVRGSLTPYGCL